jgi:hypothetical protein
MFAVVFRKKHSNTSGTQKRESAVSYSCASRVFDSPAMQSFLPDCGLEFIQSEGLCLFIHLHKKPPETDFGGQVKWPNPKVRIPRNITRNFSCSFLQYELWRHLVDSTQHGEVSIVCYRNAYSALHYQALLLTNSMQHSPS